MKEDPNHEHERRAHRDARTADLLDELASIEDRLDPEPRRRGQRLADLIVLLIIVIATIILDVQLRYPLLLVALLFVARGVTRFMAGAAGRSLRERRDHLLASQEAGEERE